jgi:adenylosuccinate synthase
VRVAAVLGGQWGDEGKGKVVDLLAGRFDVVARYHGGHNAGHTVKFADRHFALHLLPAGIIRGTTSIIGPGVVVDPDALLAEIALVEEAGIRVGGKLLLSDRATVILPWHRLLDAAREKAAGAGKLGTTLRGIGPAYESVASRKAVRVADLSRPDLLRNRTVAYFEEARRLLESYGIGDVPSVDSVLESLARSEENLRAHVTDTGRWLRDHLARGGSLLAEGAHGAMLDVSAGTFPYVTSSCCTAAGVAAGLHVPPRAVESAIVVLKAYTTRVGEGPFPTELLDATGEFLRSRGNEYGTSTGRPRRTGWFDAVVGRLAVELSGADAIAITKLDVLDDVAEIPVCVGYELDGRDVSDVPPLCEDLARVRPKLEVMRGWKSTTTGVTRFADLPAAARDYVKFLEERCGAPSILISTGPRREETIWREDLPLYAALPPVR